MPHTLVIMLLGAHMPTIGGVWKALERGTTTGCEIIQVFVKNNMQWFGRPLEPNELVKYALARAEHPVSAIFGHTGYLINLGAPSSPNRDKSIQSLVQEIEIATSLEIPFLVLHPGAHLGQGEETGLKQISAGLDEVFAATRRSPVRIALENTAGQGTCLGHRLGHLGTLFDTSHHSGRLGVCLDTAHFFAAGYDIRTSKGWRDTIKELDSLIGVDQILAFHLNDSKTDLGSRVDRHAGIGQGKIGREAFGHILNDARFDRHPGCLETPKSPDLHEDLENLAILRSLMKPKTRKYTRKT